VEWMDMVISEIASDTVQLEVKEAVNQFAAGFRLFPDE